MTAPYTPFEDSLRAFDFMLSVERLRLVVSGDTTPKLEEPVDIHVLAALRRMEEGRGT
jgi:hypothetical protein